MYSSPGMTRKIQKPLTRQRGRSRGPLDFADVLSSAAFDYGVSGQLARTPLTSMNSLAPSTEIPGIPSFLLQSILTAVTLHAFFGHFFIIMGCYFLMTLWANPAPGTGMLEEDRQFRDGFRVLGIADSDLILQDTEAGQAMTQERKSLPWRDPQCQGLAGHVARANVRHSKG